MPDTIDRLRAALADRYEGRGLLQTRADQRGVCA
jgi:hypothetical protein